MTPRTVRMKMLNQRSREQPFPRLARALHNFFLPSPKLVEKRRAGRRMIRKHDPPQTAYRHLLASGALRRQNARAQRERCESSDPFALAGPWRKRLKKTLHGEPV